MHPRALSVRGLAALAAAVLALSLVAAPLLAVPGDRSPDGLWLEVDRAELGEVRKPLPTAFRAYRLDFASLQALLASAPPEGRGRGAHGVVITLPLPDGTFAPVGVESSPVMTRTLELQYPGVRTFAFHGEGGISGRLTLDPSTVQAILRPPADYTRVTPLVTPAGTFYLSFLHRDRTDGADDFRHDHDDPREPFPEPPALRSIGDALRAAPGAAAQPVQSLQAGDQLREFRLAVASTGEYFQGRAGADPVNDVVSSIVTEINNANMVFEAELSVRLVINWFILYTDPTTDPYSTVNPPAVTVCNTRDENQAAIEAVITSADYDIGYVFNQGGGNGCAWYVVCQADKARGAGLFNTALDVGASTGLLVHEMGHQLGAHHTFSALTGSCGNPGEFNQPHAIEPGSGSTIASYLGGCSPNDVDTSVDPAGQYFHTHTFDEIITNLTVGTGSTCGSTSATTNTPPTVDAGADYTIPQGTPFTLTGSGNDADGDALSFNWEQIDVALAARNINTDPGDGPLFRSMQPAADGWTRTFPRLPDILSNTVRNGEWLPTTDRLINMRLTARDNRTGGGGVGSQDMVLTVAGPPFFVTSPNGGELLAAGCPLPVSWTVGGGSVADFVGLDFSDDGGNAWSPLLASTANDGAAQGVVPCGTTTDGRVRASAIGNVFFDVSNDDFSVEETPPVVAVAGVGGSVDDACQFEVTFTGTVVDDCGVTPAGVSVQAVKVGNNFDLGPVQYAAQQVNPTTVSVSGSVLVSNLTSSPAVVDIQLTGADACAAAAMSSTQVQVVDDTPPEIEVSVTPTVLWPPNHKLRTVNATVSATDNCGSVSYVLSSVTSSEPDNSWGDGNTFGDIQDASLGTPDTQIRLRAERRGPGPGRVYTIEYTATDGSDNETSDSAVVTVPHSRK